jgi:hypothetical protein
METNTILVHSLVPVLVSSLRTREKNVPSIPLRCPRIRAAPLLHCDAKRMASNHSDKKRLPTPTVVLKTLFEYQLNEN